jgi:hypothetical protein
MTRNVLWIALLSISLLAACGRRSGRPDHDDDDEDAVRDFGDDDDDVIIDQGGGSGDEYRGVATGSWDYEPVDGDVALVLYDGDYAEMELAVRSDERLAFTSSSSWVEIDTFGNLLGNLSGNDSSQDTVDVVIEGTISDGVAEGTWDAAGYYTNGAGTWSAFVD